SRRPHSKNLLLKQVFFRLSFMRMSTSAGGASRSETRRQARAAMCGLFASMRAGILCLPVSVLVFSDMTIQRCRQVETNNLLILKDKTGFGLSRRFEATFL
ncbi:hypothetical protein, partial [Serratia marcescens]